MRRRRIGRIVDLGSNMSVLCGDAALAQAQLVGGRVASVERDDDLEFCGKEAAEAVGEWRRTNIASWYPKDKVIVRDGVVSRKGKLV